mgnify:CR=1 FL=1
MTKFFKPEPTKAEGFSEIACVSMFKQKTEELVEKNGRIFDGWKSYDVGKDAFKTKDEAIEAAKALRAKRILALEKQIRKLKSFG